MNETATKMDPREILIIDMVKGMAALSANIVLLIAKVEDMTAALDDHRAAMDALTESTDAGTGMIDTVLNVVDDVSAVSEKEDRSVTWIDVRKVLAGLREEAEQDGDEEDGEEK